MKLEKEPFLSEQEIRAALAASLCGKTLRRVLILPPDYTRMYSYAGRLTAIYYELLRDVCEVDIMPALGTHVPMTREECLAFFGPDVSFEKILRHNWRTDVVKLGEVPASFVSEVSEGLVNEAIEVEVNKRLVSGEYDLILSIGQVVPHEVVGMANYSKNIFVGCGGSSMINSSHMLGAFYGMERVMGKDFSPVRRVFDYAEEHFIADIPLMYVLTVTTNHDDQVLLHGLYIGRERSLFEDAVALSAKKNFTRTGRPLQKAVVYLDPREFKSTWLGNKAIYRTRMAMADGGELLIIAPGVKKFGEDDENDRLIRKYGYFGRETILKLVQENDDLKQNLSVAAHLIHGSSDGRFHITYAAGGLTREEVEGAGFAYLSCEEALARYPLEKQAEGWNLAGTPDEYYYIGNPATGLWNL